MSVKLCQGLLLILFTFWFPAAVAQTSASSVQGLLAFKHSVQDPAGVLESWNTTILPEPCSTANCSSSSSAQDCNWAGIVCQNWQIVALAVPCTVLSDGSHTGCALMGSPLDILTQVPSLIFLELSGNRLQGTLPAAFATALPGLLGLFLADNALTGTLPSQWAALPNLSLLNLHNNKLTGTLPPAWGAWPNIRDLHLGSNQLSSTLPAEYGSWDSVQLLTLGNNNLHGTVPSGWSGMAQLQDLELNSNCGLCGRLPVFPTQVSNKLSWDVTHTNIGQSCKRDLCSDSNESLVIRAVVGVAIIVAVILAVCLRSWQLRRRWRQGFDVQSTWEFRLQQQCRRLLRMQSTMVPAVSSNHRSPRRRDAGMSPGQGSRRRRPKQAQPILVIMPDGYSLCFAVKENPVGGAAASSSHAIPGIANPVVPDRPAAVSPLMGDSQLQPDSNAAISLTRMHVSAPSAESGLPGSSAAATS